MDRVARLVKASTSIRRRIWASLPFHLRFADFFARLALDTTDSFGAAVYMEFHKHGIDVGLPENFDPTRHRPPTGLGKRFGSKVYRILMSKFHNPSFVDDIMMNYLIRFLETGTHKLRDNIPLAQAESYVTDGVVKQALNDLKKHKRQWNREISDVLVNDEGEGRIELPDFMDENLVEREFKRQFPRLKSQLDRIHPDASLYVKLSLIDGYTDRQIIGDVENGVPSMLTNPYTAHGKPLNEKNWQNNYKKKIKDVLGTIDFFQAVV